MECFGMLRRFGGRRMTLSWRGGHVSGEHCCHGPLSEECTRTGRRVPRLQGELPLSVFPSEAWTPMDHSNVAKAFKAGLKAAGLPGHFSPDMLRHSFASLLLADGVSPAYVEEQLGHASIELTVGTYSWWLRRKAPGALDRRDGHPQEESGSKNRGQP
jgi:integrase